MKKEKKNNSLPIMTGIAGCLLFTLVIIFCIISRKTVVGDNIYGYWQLETPMTFDRFAYTKLEFINDTTVWIEPVVNDSIYFYKQVHIDRDSLRLTDYYGKKETWEILELHDTVLIVKIPDIKEKLKYRKTLDSEEKVRPLPGSVTLRHPKFISVSAKEIGKDSLDVLVKSPLPYEYYIWRGDTPHILTLQEFAEAKEILKDYFIKKAYLEDEYPSNDDAYPLEEYFRQYASYVHDNHIIVEVCFSTNYISFDGYTALKKDLVLVNDGGHNHAKAGIDLTKRKVLSFMTNGPHQIIPKKR